MVIKHMLFLSLVIGGTLQAVYKERVHVESAPQHHAQEQTVLQAPAQRISTMRKVAIGAAIATGWVAMNYFFGWLNDWKGPFVPDWGYAG